MYGYGFFPARGIVGGGEGGGGWGREMGEGEGDDPHFPKIPSYPLIHKRASPPGL